ncbi:MAG: response regulator [Chloroflexota bacterium]|jgi:DNA-binding response OmpR family regulator
MIRVLVVDDESDLAEYLADELKVEGFRAETAYDGVEAVIKLIDEKWDVALFDIRMPKLDGISALRIIKRIKPDMPIVMFTGQAGRGDIITSSELGAYACLLKPVSIDQLKKTIHLIMHTNS